MSVRAYRQITAPVLAGAPSFNLWHDTTLIDDLLALPSTFDGLNDTGGGHIEIDKRDLIKYLDEKKKTLDEATQALLWADVWNTDGEYINYECY